MPFWAGKFKQLKHTFKTRGRPGLCPWNNGFCFFLATQWMRSKKTKCIGCPMRNGRFDILWTTSEKATVTEITAFMLMHYYIVRLYDISLDNVSNFSNQLEKRCGYLFNAAFGGCRQQRSHLKCCSRKIVCFLWKLQNWNPC